MKPSIFNQPSIQKRSLGRAMIFHWVFTRRARFSHSMIGASIVAALILGTTLLGGAPLGSISRNIAGLLLCAAVMVALVSVVLFFAQQRTLYISPRRISLARIPGRRRSIRWEDVTSISFWPMILASPDQTIKFYPADFKSLAEIENLIKSHLSAHFDFQTPTLYESVLAKHRSQSILRRAIRVIVISIVFAVPAMIGYWLGITNLLTTRAASFFLVFSPIIIGWTVAFAMLRKQFRLSRHQNTRIKISPAR